MRSSRGGGPRRASIVIRALNEAEHLPALLEGIDQQSVLPHEIVLVDSGSVDDTVAVCSARGVKVVHIDPSEFSFGRSLNRGCRAASGDVLVFVSAHVYPTDVQWLERLIEPFEDDDVALVYGRQVGDDRSHFSEVQLMRRWFPPTSDLDQKTAFCNNANCAVRRSWWQEMPYDEDLTGLEDLDWATRALERGGRIVYRADATVAHVHEEGFGRIRDRYRREAIAHRRIVPDQRLGLLEALGLFVASVARDYLASVTWGAFRRSVWSIPMFRAAQYLGTWQGFRTRGPVSNDLRRRFYYPVGFDQHQLRRRAKRANR